MNLNLGKPSMQKGSWVADIIPEGEGGGASPQSVTFQSYFLNLYTFKQVVHN